VRPSRKVEAIFLGERAFLKEYELMQHREKELYYQMAI